MFPHSKTTSRTHIVAFLLGAFCAALPMTSAHAQGKKGAATEEAEVGNKSDKLDVSDLEKKYWAAKDSDFSVVQNRTYSKAGRFGASVTYGTLLSDPYTEATNWSGSLMYYPSERWGVELNYTEAKPEDTKSVEYFKSRYGATPDHGKVTQFYGAALNFVPFYAKMSVMNSAIMYFDMQFSPGVGMTTYEAQIHNDPSIEEQAFTLTFDVTQQFFISKHIAFRADFKNRWFKEDVLSAGGSVTAGTKVKDDWTHNSLLLFGVTFFL